MKRNAVLSYILAVLEGGLAGACCYQAGTETCRKRRALWYICGAGWFGLSLMDSLEGSKSLKEAANPGENLEQIDAEETTVE